jgi:fatty acid desaturase
MWFLIHEAIHRNLNSNKQVNEFMGRILSILFGASFHGLSFGHIIHHSLNRKWESEYSNNAPDYLSRAKYYFKIFFGVYLVEVTGSLLLGFFNKKTVLSVISVHQDYSEQLQNQIDNFFYKKNRIGMVRTDMSLSIILFTVSAFLFGKFWPLFIALILIRAISISYMDNIFHYGTPEDNSVPGKVVRAGRMVELFILNGNYHGIHHSNPTIPWNKLPLEAKMNNYDYNESFSESFIAQLNGPIAI